VNAARLVPASICAMRSSAAKVARMPSVSAIACYMARLLARRLEPLAQTAQRRPQVVGDVARHLAQALHEGVQSVQHLVDAVGKLVQLVAGAADRHAHGEVPVHDRAGRPVDRVEPPEERRADRETADDSQQDGRP
jgi:hypothetical protein